MPAEADADELENNHQTEVRYINKGGLMFFQFIFLFFFIWIIRDAYYANLPVELFFLHVGDLCMSEIMVPEEAQGLKEPKKNIICFGVLCIDRD